MDDLISREEAISTVKSMLYQTALNNVESDEKAAQLYEDIADSRITIWLKLVDSVDAVPVRHGHWIYKRGCWAECSECHHNFNDVYDLENSDNYCRHCGAKMDGDT